MIHVLTIDQEIPIGQYIELTTMPEEIKFNLKEQELLVNVPVKITADPSEPYHAMRKCDVNNGEYFKTVGSANYAYKYQDSGCVIDWRDTESGKSGYCYMREGGFTTQLKDANSTGTFILGFGGGLPNMIMEYENQYGKNSFTLTPNVFQLEGIPITLNRDAVTDDQVPRLSQVKRLIQEALGQS